jgi:hypothetical protein
LIQFPRYNNPRVAQSYLDASDDAAGIGDKEVTLTPIGFELVVNIQD